jgi:hypothetical protein
MLAHKSVPPYLLSSTADCGLVVAGQTGGAEGGVANTFAGVPVTAWVTDDTSGGGFQITGLTTYNVQPVDPGELPPGHKGPPPLELIVVSQVAGAGPISTAEADYIAVEVSFSAPSAPTAFRYTGLAVLGAGPGTAVAVPLAALVAGISTTVSGPPRVIRQGSEGDIPIMVRSVNAAGPAARVNYTLARNVPPGIETAGSWYVEVPPGETVQTTLRVAVGDTVPIGPQSVPIMESAFFGSGNTGHNQQYTAVTPAATIQVVAGEVAVYPAGDPAMFGRQGSRVHCNIVVTSDGQQANPVQLTWGQVPAGVHATPITAPAALGTVVYGILDIDWNAPVAQQQPVEISWVAQDGQRGTLHLTLTIGLGMIIWRSGQIHAGQVMGWAELALLWDGRYSFHGHLHDNSSVQGDNFAIAMTPKFNGGAPRVFKEEGSLGALVGPSRDYDWQHDGSDPWIAQYWDQIASQGFSGTLQTSPSLDQLFDLILSALGILALGGAAVILLGGAPQGEWEPDGSGGTYVVPISGSDPPGE